MTQDERFERMYRLVVEYIGANKRLPSRHRIEDHRLLNWLKYQRKLANQNQLPPQRMKLWQDLQMFMERYQRVNQHAYVDYRKPTASVEPTLFDDV